MSRFVAAVEASDASVCEAQGARALRGVAMTEPPPLLKGHGPAELDPRQGTATQPFANTSCRCIRVARPLQAFLRACEVRVSSFLEVHILERKNGDAHGTQHFSG